VKYEFLKYIIDISSNQISNLLEINAVLRENEKLEIKHIAVSISMKY